MKKIRSLLKTIAIIMIAFAVAAIAQNGNLEDWIEHNETAQLLTIVVGGQLYFWSDALSREEEEDHEP